MSTLIEFDEVCKYYLCILCLKIYLQLSLQL